jgi:hypothetical protein
MIGKVNKDGRNFADLESMLVCLPAARGESSNAKGIFSRAVVCIQLGFLFMPACFKINGATN